MPSADQVPVNKPHSTMQWHLWVVLITGSTGSALRAARPPNLHITPRLARSASRRQCDGFSVPLALGHYCPSHSGDLVGECDGGNLCGPSRQQRREPRSVFGAVALGIADYGQRAEAGSQLEDKRSPLGRPSAEAELERRQTETGQHQQATVG